MSHGAAVRVLHAKIDGALRLFQQWHGSGLRITCGTPTAGRAPLSRGSARAGRVSNEIAFEDQKGDVGHGGQLVTSRVTDENQRPPAPPPPPPTHTTNEYTQRGVEGCCWALGRFPDTPIVLELRRSDARSLRWDGRLSDPFHDQWKMAASVSTSPLIWHILLFAVLCLINVSTSAQNNQFFKNQGRISVFCFLVPRRICGCDRALWSWWILFYVVHNALFRFQHTLNVS